MNITGIIALLAGAGLLYVAVQHLKGKMSFVGKSKGRAQLAGLLVGYFAVFGILGAFSPSTAESFPFLGSWVTVTNPISLKAQSAGVDGANTGALSTSLGKKSIESLTFSAQEEGSNSWTAAAGTLNVYSADVNPSSATANPIDTITVASGTGSTNDSLITTGVPYRVVFEGTNHYDKDYGVVTFDGNDLSLNGVLHMDGGKVQLVATLDDILNENENSTTDANGVMNGQADTVLGTDEIGCTTFCAADGTFLYDESVGDGVWYIDVSPGASGANAVAKNVVLQFKHDLTNPPEGDEYSSITAQLRTGTDFGVPSDITNNWKDEIPIELGDMKAGQSATYRLTFNVVEANEDGNDDWTLRFDDLGQHLGRDIRNSVRATADTVTYGGSQA